MSERILETLMQLFAIIAKPRSNANERRGVVEVFLRRLLNQELAKKYLATYDEKFEEARKKLEKSSSDKREGAIAIRIQKLCKEINEQGQLDQEQRIVVVIQVLEFCKSGDQEVSQLELGFIETLAEGLNITHDEYCNIERFVLNEFSNVPAISELLIINGIRNFETKEARHAYKDLLKGTIWILFLSFGKQIFCKVYWFGRIIIKRTVAHGG